MKKVKAAKIFYPVPSSKVTRLKPPRRGQFEGIIKSSHSVPYLEVVLLGILDFWKIWVILKYPLYRGNLHCFYLGGFFQILSTVVCWVENENLSTDM